MTFASGSSLGIDTTNAGGSLTYAGNITASGLGITKLGTGSLVLSGTNTYTGGTAVQAGTLQINAGASIASTSISVSAGATLLLAGSTAALPTTANITNGSGSGSQGNFVLTGMATQTVGTVSGASYMVPDSSSVNATAYSGNTTVGDGTNAANLTAMQILQNTLTINAGSTVTIAPSGPGISNGVSVASAAAGDSATTADSSSDSGSASTEIHWPPFKRRSHPARSAL